MAIGEISPTAILLATLFAPQSSAAPERSPCALVNPRRRMIARRLAPSFLDQRTLTFGQRPECLVARYCCKHLVVVPWILRLLWTLHLHEEHVMNHAPIHSDFSALCEKIVYRRLAHFLHHSNAVRCASGFYRLEVVGDGRIDACMGHGRHSLATFEKPLRPLPSL